MKNQSTDCIVSDICNVIISIESVTLLNIWSIIYVFIQYPRYGHNIVAAEV